VFPSKKCRVGKWWQVSKIRFFGSKKLWKFWAAPNPFNNYYYYYYLSVWTTLTSDIELLLHPMTLVRNFLLIQNWTTVWTNMMSFQQVDGWQSVDVRNSARMMLSTDWSNQSGSLWMKESMKRSHSIHYPRIFIHWRGVTVMDVIQLNCQLLSIEGGNGYGCHPTKLSRNNRGF
jgi:hypothetical protein